MSWRRVCFVKADNKGDFGMIRSWFLGGLALASMLIGVNAGAVAAEKITFMIDWLPSGDKAVAYLGVQKGLFAAEGLEV